MGLKYADSEQRDELPVIRRSFRWLINEVFRSFSGLENNLLPQKHRVYIQV